MSGKRTRFGTISAPGACFTTHATMVVGVVVLLAALIPIAGLWQAWVVRGTSRWRALAAANLLVAILLGGLLDRGLVLAPSSVLPVAWDAWLRGGVEFLRREQRIAWFFLLLNFCLLPLTGALTLARLAEWRRGRSR